MKTTTRPIARAIRTALAALSLASAASADDSDLFSTTAVSPNVLLLMDNSASMNTIIFHPAFDPSQTYSCTSTTYGSFPGTASGAFDPNATYYAEGNDFYYRNSSGSLVGPLSMPLTHCGKTHTLPTDANASIDPAFTSPPHRWTRYTGAYLNWLFSAESDPYWSEISAKTNGVPSSCVGGAGFDLYGRTRMNVSKQILKDVVCQVNLIGQVRFGIAVFRSDLSDPNGGFVLEPVDLPSSNQQADLVSAINSIDADTWTPLGESLFQVYTYFMSRSTADIPYGQNGTTKFPAYQYNTSTSSVGGGYTTNSTLIPPDPVQYSCQKNFVIIVTDGDPTKDDFDLSSPSLTAQGFGSFSSLIGDYNADGETENNANVVCSGCESAFYLDDIAKYMHEKDFRPDFQGEQTLDVYAIGFSSGGTADALLSKTASVADGLFFSASNPAQLAQAIIDSLQDIVEKSQSFTAATVPASRTAAGEQIYVSLFTPSAKSPYWDGRLRSYRLTANGQILDANGTCAIDDPSGNCDSGPFLPTASHPPYWDAADEMPSPGARDLLVSKLNLLGNPTIVDFQHLSNGGPLQAADLGVTYPPTTPYTGSIATDAESLSAEIISNVRGCYFGTGANGVVCDTRPAVLSDIFHSNPVVVGRPSGTDADPSYAAFKSAHATRDRVIYAGSNGGFMHGFHAGDWLPSASPPQYDAGTGTELFGFMPWPSRQVVKNLPNDTGGRDYYFVDGTPQAADAWLYTLPTQTVKSLTGTEWRTVLLGGLRQGGGAYFALDVTDPGATSCPAGESGSGYPCYLWEFPKENDAAAIKNTFGETWGEPVITKIKLSVSGTQVERWVAIVSGGYDASGDPNAPATYSASATQGRSLWIVDLKTGRPLASRSFDTSGDCTLALSSQANDEQGMCFALAATPAVYDLDFDGFADLIVAVDLGGNVWKWVIKPVGYDPVNDATKTLADNDAVWPFRKFFRAPAYGNNPYYYKSFFFPPAATLKNGTLWYAFGSGERNELLYMSDPSTTADNNRFYLVKDLDPLDAGTTLQPLITEADLLDVSNNSTCADISAYKGYFIVATEGEKWVTNVEILSGYVFVSSYVPVANADPCLIGGQAYLYAFRAYCGEPFYPSANAAAVDPRAIDIGAGFPTDPRLTIGPGGDADVIITKQGGEIVTKKAGSIGTGGLYYWRVND